MTLTPHIRITKQLAILVGISAAILAGKPVIAQQYPDFTQSPAQPSEQMQDQTQDQTQDQMQDQMQQDSQLNNNPMQQDSTNQANPSASNIVQVASGNQSFNTLTQAIQAAGLTETLSGQGPYTVFAPTDEAFAQLPDGALQFLLRPENQDLLRQVLTYHVVSGEVPANQVRTGAVETLGGGLAVRVTPNNRVVVNDASVIQPDIQATNGVIHAVNRVLLPANLRQQLINRLGTQQSYQ